MDKSFSTSDENDLLNSSAQEEFDSHGKELFEFIMQLKKELG